MLRALSVYGAARSWIATLGDVAFGKALDEFADEHEADDQTQLTSGRFLLAADIRLDNRAELARLLGIARPAGLSDSGLLLMAWEHWGPKALDRIVGDYAFAIHDNKSRTIALVRDPTGQRPLYYALEGKQLVFASMPSAILANPLIATGIDFGATASMIAGTDDRLGAATYFSSVERVRAGEIVVHSTAGIERRWHWVPPQDFLAMSPDDYVSAYRQLLDEAVAAASRRIAGDLAVHLSSGWDSSAVAATAAMLARDGAKPIAYTAAPRIGFDGRVPPSRFADESSLAALLAAQHGFKHQIVRTDRAVLDGLRDYLRFYQEPLCNLANMEWIGRIHELAKARGVTTLLSGQMGNLTLNAGGLPALAEWVARGQWSTWWKEARAATRGSKARWRAALFYSFERHVPRTAAELLHRKFRGAPNAAAQSFARKEWLDRGRPCKRARDTQDARGHYPSRLELVRSNDVGNFRKGALARFGIDERDPTADRRLLDFSFALPPEQLLHRGEWRPLARRALADRVPAQILDSPLRGYQGADWFERIGPRAARETLEEIGSSSTVRDLLDLAKMERAIDRWPERGWEQPHIIQIYRMRLPIALATGAFIQLFEPVAARRKAI